MSCSGENTAMTVALLCPALLFRAGRAQPASRVLGSLLAVTAHGDLSLTTMSDYDFRPGGSLKLKGVAEGGVVKK